MNSNKSILRTPAHLLKEGEIVWCFRLNSKARIVETLILPFGSPYGPIDPYWIWLSVYVFELQDYLLMGPEDMCLLSDLTPLERALFNIP